MVSKPMSSYEKRKVIMKGRLQELPKTNPIIAKAIKNQEPPESDRKWDQWNIVDELVSAARQEYMKEDGKLQPTLTNLAKAIAELAKKPPMKMPTVKAEIGACCDYD